MSLSEIETRDPIALKLKLYAENVLVLVFGLLPLFFVPVASAPFDFSKILFVLGGIVLALVLYSLSALRSGKIAISFPYTLLSLWAIAAVALASALLSGDLRDALIGDVFSIHSTAFLGVIALSASVWTLLNTDKKSVMRLYILLSASTLVLFLFHVVRLIFGPEMLSFNVFTSTVSTPLGGWNDLGIFLGLIVLLSLVALEQLPLTRNGRVLFGIVTIFALLMLTAINFISIWIILSLASLAVLVYTLTKDRLGNAERSLGIDKETNTSSLVLSLLVFSVSVLFIIGGSYIGGIISKYTDISYIEVRPSLEATTDIARGVYGENAFVGIGPNKFVDAWRLYKDPAINATVFWNTQFNAGNGYIPTFFVTAGVLGGIVWLVFLGLFLFAGFRLLVKAPNRDRMWYFIGLSSFVSAAYIWGLSIVYVPGVVVLIIGALFTGLTFVAQNALEYERMRVISVGANKRTGFAFTLVVIVVIIGSVSALYTAGKLYASAYTFNKAVASIQVGTNIEEIEAEIASAFELSANDAFARRIAEYQLARINSLLSVTAPTEAQQQQFQSAFVNGVNAGQQAVARDDSEPENWAVLGNIYAILVSINIEGSYDRAVEALTKARDLDPKNPLRYLALAQLEARQNNLEGSRNFAEEAIRLKGNYSDAYFFLTQLEIAAGDVPKAIESTKAMIALEPQNAARHYQLGVLESAQGNTEAAVVSFEEAVQLDPNYANAMYFLALGYDALGRPQEARGLLARVLELNPGNQDVTGLINALDTNGTLGQVPQGDTQPVVGDATVTEENGVVTTTEDPDSPLVTPVNSTPPELANPAGSGSPDEEESGG